MTSIQWGGDPSHTPIAPLSAMPRLVDLISPRAAAGQRQMMKTLERKVRRVDAQLCDLLGGAAGFAEPLLFAWNEGIVPSLGLRQILYGYVPPERRAELGPVDVRADRAGRVYLPNMGHLRTDPTEQGLVLKWSPSTHQPTLWRRGSAMSCTLDELSRLPGTDIEICRDDESLGHIFRNLTGTPYTAGLQSSAEGCPSHLLSAIHILKDQSHFYRDIARHARKVALFDAPNLNSFAATAVHGLALMNARHGTDEIFFVEDLAHQAGHVVFEAAAIVSSDLFEVSPDTVLDESHESDEAEQRTLYVALHGVVTEAMIVDVLTQCLNSGRFAGRQRHELAGRLANIARRFFLDLRELNRPGIFGPFGEQILVELMGVLSGLLQCHGSLIHAVDVSNQPYNFSYERFCERNPSLVEV
jgi:hypothetical protein